MSAVSLNTHLDMSGSECLNVDDDHPLENCLQDSPALLKSDCDEQLILALAFNQVVKIQSLKIRAPANAGPKTLRVFKNQPRSLDFSQAESFESVQVFNCPVHIDRSQIFHNFQDIELSPESLKGEKEVALKFVKFQDVQNIQFFVKDNQVCIKQF